MMLTPKSASFLSHGLCCMLSTSIKASAVARVDWIERADVPAEAPATVGGVDGHDRHPPVAAGWLSAPAVEVATLRALPLFQGIDDDDLRRVAEWAKERTAGPGDVVVKQWDQSKEFFVLLDGSVEVRAGHRTVAIREPGDFFGELAALDWGAGFGYPRLASVVARSPVRLLTLTPGRFTSWSGRSRSSEAASDGRCGNASRACSHGRAMAEHRGRVRHGAPKPLAGPDRSGLPRVLHGRMGHMDRGDGVRLRTRRRHRGRAGGD